MTQAGKGEMREDGAICLPSSLMGQKMFPVKKDMDDLMAEQLKEQMKTLRSGEDGRKMLKRIILCDPLRFYFIDKVKRPLMKAIMVLASRYPEPTHDNIDQLVAHTMLDIFDLLLSYENNLSRKPLFQAAGRVIVGEIEHDSYYGQRFQFLLEEIIKAILDDKWLARELGQPSSYWKEPRPYGGEHSIIQKLIDHRKQIKSILDDDGR